MSPRSSSGDTAYVWSLSLRDLIVLVLFADLAMLAKALLRIPLHVPGHSGILWVALFVVARGLVDKKGAGLLLGVVAGVVATVLGFGDTGPLEWTKYVAAGAMLELVCLLVPGTLEGFGKAAVAGAAAHLGKLASMVIVAVVAAVAARLRRARPRVLGGDAPRLRGHRRRHRRAPAASPAAGPVLRCRPAAPRESPGEAS